jgi:hypothetical protein
LPKTWIDGKSTLTGAAGAPTLDIASSHLGDSVTDVDRQQLGLAICTFCRRLQHVDHHVILYPQVAYVTT